MDKLDEKIEAVISGIVVDVTDENSRKNLKNIIEKQMGFEFTDITTAEDIKNGIIVLDGLNTKTEKIITVTVRNA